MELQFRWTALGARCSLFQQNLGAPFSNPSAVGIKACVLHEHHGLIVEVSINVFAIFQRWGCNESGPLQRMNDPFS